MWSCSSEPGMRRSPSYEHAVLLSLGAQEGESVPDEGVGISDHVAPQRRGAHEVLVYVGEGFHHECATIVDVLEAAEDRVPVDVGSPRRAAVGLGEVDVTEPGSQRDDRLVEALLFYVHVVRVEVDEDVGLVYPVQQLIGLGGKVDEIRLVAVDGLDTELDTVFGGATGNPPQDAGDGLQLWGLRRLAC